MSHKYRHGNAHKMDNAECPSCGETVFISRPHLGKKVACPHCKMGWEIIWMDPLELDWPYYEEQDEYFDPYEEENR